MKVDFFGSVKFSKPFKMFDILLYVISFIVILTFLLGFAFPKKDVSAGFKVELNGKTVLYYYFESQKVEITEGYSSLVEIIEDCITVYTDAEKTEYNVLKIDKVNNSVSVSGSNCSTRQDCVHTAPVNKNGGVIICMPHKLKILPINAGYVPPVTI